MATERLTIGLYSPVPQSGKSTVAEILKNRFGFEQRPFAGPLKRLVVDLLWSAGFDPERIGQLMTRDKEAPIPELGDKSFRYLMQTIGTDWGRKLIDKDLWVKLILNAPQRADLVVIEDVRFPNEYDAVLADGGQMWRIERPGASLPNDHPSEGLLEDREFDEVIVNDGSLEALEDKVIAALSGAV